jgi:hypothetical protein
MMNPARTAGGFPGNAAAASAKGASATVSIRPSVTSERQRPRTPTGQPGYRRTMAIRTASSKRPGNAMPMSEAPPPAAASARGPGRSVFLKSQRQP